MTKRERMLATLHRERPDIISWGGDLAYWIGGLGQDGKLDPRYGGDEGIFRLHRDLHVGFYLQGFFPFLTLYDGVDIRTETSGNLSTTRYVTPKGTLTEVWEYNAQTYSSGPREHLIKDIDDLSILRYIYEHTHYEPDYERVGIFRDGIGDNGVVLCYTPRSPFMELVATKSGIENLTYIIADGEDEFDATLEIMTAKHLAASELTLKSGCECVMVPENLSSEVVGKYYYEKYVRRYHNHITDRIRDAGKFSFIHMDGTLAGLLCEISEAGFDVIEAMTPSPAGDLSIEDIARITHPNTIVWGGIPGGYFHDIVSDEEFDAYVRHVLEVLCRRPNSALGVADQIVPGSRPERIKRVNELVERYGAVLF